MKLIIQAVVILVPWACRGYGQFIDPDASPERKITAASIREAESLFDIYRANRDKIRRYAVAMRVEHTREDFSESEKTFASQSWYIHCKDSDLGLVRHGDAIVRQGITKDGIIFSQPETAFSSIFEKEGVKQVFHNAATQMVNETEHPADLENLLQRQSNFDPWDLPIVGSECLIPHRSTRPMRVELPGLDKLEHFESILPHAFVQYEYAKDYSRGFQFDKTVGNMPVTTTLLSRENNYSGVIALVKSKWKFKDHAWLPVEILIADVIGNPQQPSRKETRHFFLYWVLGTNLPNTVFSSEPDNIISHNKLLRSIVEYSSVNSD